MRGDENYKWLWGAEEENNVRYTLFNNNARSLLFRYITKTYYNNHFNKKPVIIRASVKILIRIATLMFINYNKLIPRSRI